MIMIIYLAALGLSCSMQDLYCSFSSCGSGSFVAHRFSCSMVCWESQFPDQGLTPALQGRFITTEPPGKSLVIITVAPESWQDQMVPRTQDWVSISLFNWVFFFPLASGFAILGPFLSLEASLPFSFQASFLFSLQSPLVATSHCVRAWFPSVNKDKL